MDTKDVDAIIIKIKKSNSKEQLNNFIKEFQPFIIKIVSEYKNSYIELENDEEFSIGLIAFNEAIERYDSSKGHFMPYAKLVILSRLKNHSQSEKRFKYVEIDQIENDIKVSYEINDSNLAFEINEFQSELKHFNMDFETLVYNSPKHKDTRIKVFETGEKVSKEDDLVILTYDKKRLPITKIAERFFVSPKFLKSNKYIIIAVIIINIKNFSLLKNWINKN